MIFYKKRDIKKIDRIDYIDHPFLRREENETKTELRRKIIKEFQSKAHYFKVYADCIAKISTTDTAIEETLQQCESYQKIENRIKQMVLYLLLTLSVFFLIQWYN